MTRLSHVVRNTYRLNWLVRVGVPFPNLGAFPFHKHMYNCTCCLHLLEIVRIAFVLNLVMELYSLRFSHFWPSQGNCKDARSWILVQPFPWIVAPRVQSFVRYVRESPLPQHSSIIPTNFEDPTAELPSLSASSFRIPIVLFIIVVILRFLPFQFAAFVDWIEHGKKVILCQGWKFYLFWKQC